MGKAKLTTFRIVRIALFTAILFVQEELLSGIPNVQFTQALIAIYAYSFGLLDTTIIVILHTLFDNLFIGSLNLVYTPAMLIGWLSLVLILYLMRRVKNKYIISAVVCIHGLFYCWCFAITSAIFLHIDLWAYLVADFPFELIMVVNGFITTFLLLNPLTKVLKKLEDRIIRDDNNDTKDNNEQQDSEIDIKE